MPSQKTTATEIQGIVRRLNDAWLGRRFEELGALFHPDAVMVAPGSSIRIVGRDACVASYHDFVSAATVHAFRAAPAEVDVIGAVAIARVPYEVDYEIDSDAGEETARTCSFSAHLRTSGWSAGG